MLNRFLYSVAIFCICSLPGQSQHPVINEVMYSNRSCITDCDGDKPDWIEIYNPGSLIINLENWQLTDDITKSKYWSFPAYSLGPDQYLIVFLSGKERYDASEFHTDFSLQLAKEPLFLLNPEGLISCKYEVRCVPPDVSIGMKPDASGEIVLLRPSPGLSNNQSSTVQINYQQDTLLFSHQGGFHNELIQLELSNKYAENTIHYTLDGSIPDDQSFPYVQPLSLQDQTDRENAISGIRTSEKWIMPGSDISKFPVTRAIVYSHGCPASPVYSKTYFVNKQDHKRYEIPVVSLITDPKNLFDEEKGIYVSGNHYNFSQRGKNWERPVHFEYFDPDGALLIDQDIGIRIHGAGSRAAPQKSLRLYARHEYGKEEFQYPFFEYKPDLNSFKTLILRNARDWPGNTLFREELCHHLVRNLDLDYMAGQTVVAFINGEYWGIHSLRERQDEYYIRNNHQICDTEIDVIAHRRKMGVVVEQGNDSEYTELVTYLESADLSDDNVYREVSGRIDIQNFIDYYITELYFSNWDFPHNNFKTWRPDTGDGKWRLFFFDCDNCMSRTQYDHISEYTNQSDYLQIHEECTTFVFRKLLENSGFRASFNRQFLYHLNTTFHPDTVVGMINEYQELYLPIVGEHIYQWQRPNEVIKWMHNVDMLRIFALQRPSQITMQLVKNFGIPIQIIPNPSNGNFHIRHLLGENCEIQVEIHSVSGVSVLRQRFMPDHGNDIPVLADLADGVYLISVMNENMIFSEKLFIQQ